MSRNYWPFFHSDGGKVAKPDRGQVVDVVVIGTGAGGAPILARLHLDKIGVQLTTLSDKQSDYISIPKAGPYKPDTYRY